MMCIIKGNGQRYSLALYLIRCLSIYFGNIKQLF